MAFDENIDCISVVAGENLNDDDGKFVKLNASGRAILVTAITDLPVGILAENPTLRGVTGDDSTGRVVSIATLKPGSTVKAKAGGTVTAGNVAIMNTSALVVDGGAAPASVALDTVIVGVFRESGVINQWVSFIAMNMQSGGAT